MNAIAVILARAGSKGLPGKNAAPVAGKPCVAWTIEAALRSGAIEHTALSTDGPELLAIGDAFGVHTIERPADLAGDTARVDDAARHAVAWLAERGLRAQPATPIVILYGNVPVRPDGLIDRAVELLVSSGADSVQSYAPVGKHHPWWTARLGGDGRVRPWEGDVLNNGVFRRQDLPPAYIPDGGVLAVTRRALFLEIPGVAPGPHAFFGADRRGVVSDGDVIDIDTHTDLLVAEAVLSTRSPAPAPTPQNRDRKGAGPVQARPLSPTPGRTAPAPPHTRTPPLAYFITFRTYGSLLHGDDRSSVDRHRNEHGGPSIAPDPDLEAEPRRRLKQAPVTLSQRQRQVIDLTVRAVCQHRGWMLHAINARTTHVHLVVTAPAPPEQVMNAMKSWCTRRLGEFGLLPDGGRVWSRHGSTKHVWDKAGLLETCDYVLNRLDGHGDDAP